MENDKKQYHIMQIIMGACVGIFLVVLVSAIILVPKAAKAIDMMETIQSNLDQESLSVLMQDVDELIVTLNQKVQDMTDQLSQMDVENLNNAIKNLSDAAEKMDIEELNRAITNLSDIMEPLAKLMNRS